MQVLECCVPIIVLDSHMAMSCTEAEYSTISHGIILAYYNLMYFLFKYMYKIYIPDIIINKYEYRLNII